ncbi:hypothetical protein ACFU5Y_06005 [Streptomyces gardneri]
MASTLLPIERVDGVEREEQEQAAQMMRGGRRILGGGPYTGA